VSALRPRRVRATRLENTPGEGFGHDGSAPDPLEQLKQLGELKASGVLTEAEFEAQKAKILAG
jgi:hypothetical protein